MLEYRQGCCRYLLPRKYRSATIPPLWIDRDFLREQKATVFFCRRRDFCKQNACPAMRAGSLFCGRPEGSYPSGGGKVPTQSVSRRLFCNFRKGLIQIGQNVIHILQTDRQTDHAGVDARRDQLLIR